MGEKPRFGDIVENGWASVDNPTRTGFFVRQGCRTGRMNAGPYVEVTDGHGKFWELPMDKGHRVTFRPAADALEALSPSPQGEGWRHDGYECEVLQGGEWVAGAEAEGLCDVEAEAQHYAAMYGQDGPVEVHIWERGKRPLSFVSRLSDGGSMASRDHDPTTFAAPPVGLAGQESGGTEP